MRKAEQVIFTVHDKIASKILFKALEEKHLNKGEGLNHLLLD